MIFTSEMKNIETIRTLKFELIWANWTIDPIWAKTIVTAFYAFCIDLRSASLLAASGVTTHFGYLKSQVILISKIQVFYDAQTLKKSDKKYVYDFGYIVCNIY